jgi:hypothetical protein
MTAAKLKQRNDQQSTVNFKSQMVQRKMIREVIKNFFYNENQFVHKSI